MRWVRKFQEALVPYLNLDIFVINPLIRPNVPIQILNTDLNTFPQRMCWEKKW